MPINVRVGQPITATVRRTSSPAGTPTYTETFIDIDTFLSWVKSNGFPCIVLVEDDAQGKQTVELEIYDA